MNGKRGTKGNANPKQAIWINLPRTGQVTRELDDQGAADVTGENPGFGDAPYCVSLGLRVHERGPQICYGTLDSPTEGDYLYAEVQTSGSFDVHIRAQSLHNQLVTMVWWATRAIGSTTGPTPTPKPTYAMLPGSTTPMEPFGPKDFPGRTVDEVPGIGAEYARRLSSGGIGGLAALACARATDVAALLGIREVRAMSFIDQARRLLEKKTGR